MLRRIESRARLGRRASSAGEVELEYGRSPRESDDPPIHFLEALWRVIAKKHRQDIIKPERNSTVFLRSGFSLRKEMYNYGNITSYTHRPVLFANLIAFEVSPNSNTSLAVLSYAILMKSLIKSTQERGIMLNRLTNLEKVVEVFKEMVTFGLHDHDVFGDVKREIEEHCKSRARTWIAELIYTRFRTPWTTIAFFAAAILLCLTFLQTFFTIRR